MVIGLCGCAEPEPTETDEAFKRAGVEGVSVAAAAQRYNYNTTQQSDRDGYGADKEDGEEGEESYGTREWIVYDYFPGMDAISVRLESEPDCPDQLLDTLVKTDEQDSDPNKKFEPEGRPQTQVVTPDLSKNEIVGRNTWMAWCGGNEGFWDWLATDSVGFIDFVKLVDTRKRELRFKDTGMINEPGMEQRSQHSEFGLWLDQPEDERIRAWRKAFVRQTFDKIADRKHKSQVGLTKGPKYNEAQQEELYQGDAKAYADEGYLYPSDYIRTDGKRRLDLEYRGGKGSNDATEYGDEDPDYLKKLYDSRDLEAISLYSFLDKTILPPDMYGLSSGIVGLRLFPNPYFDDDARQAWNARRFYNKKDDYSTDPALIRPYRVGMACAFCHASFHPLRPPRDNHNPSWENISGNIGAQYLSMRATVGNLLTRDQFVYHLLDSQPRGTIDTSLVASDNINNPNTMNAVFGLKERAFLSLHNPREVISRASVQLPSLYAGQPNDPVPQAIIDELTEYGLGDKLDHLNDEQRYVPRILLDGSDSIGTWGALARVYLNIGTYWERWNQLHQVVLGFTPQQPFRINDCEKYSVYWNATEQRVPGLRDYFLKITPPMPLLSTEGGLERIHHRPPATNERFVSRSKSRDRASGVNVDLLQHGRKVFANNCIVCHSSIQPETAMMMNDYSDDYSELVERRMEIRSANELNGEFYEHDPGQWLNDPDYIRWAEAAVEKRDFWNNNYLSNDYRVPVTIVGTNSARAMATNGMTDHMWEDFASEDYRQLPSPGEIRYFNPYAGEKGEWDTYSPRHKTAEGVPPQGGGPGYYRVPTLISIWATAPLLHNNSLGLYNNDPSVDGRLEAFDDAIRKMLWPEKRLESSSYNGATAERLKQDQGLIWRTPQETYLSLDSRRVPAFAKRGIASVGLWHNHPWLSWLDDVTLPWLPSLILVVASLFLLVTVMARYRRPIGILLLVAAAVLGIALWLGRSVSVLSVLDWSRWIYPWWLPLSIVVVVGLALVLLKSAAKVRWIAYSKLIVGIVLGGIIYFNAGRLGDVQIGPIPEGTPVNLLANFNSEADRIDQVKSVRTAVAGLAEIESRKLPNDEARKLLREKVAPALMSVNKCPDFVMDRGHYFPWFDSMDDKDKNALIELLKTF